MSAPDVVVVGGGAIGAAVAHAAAREGLRATLLEASDLAAGASGALAGMLTPVSERLPPGPLLDLALRSLAAFPALAAELLAESGIDIDLVPSGTLRIACSEESAGALRAHAARIDDASAARLGTSWLDAQALRAECPDVSAAARGALFVRAEAHLRPPLLVRALATAARALGAEIVTGEPALALEIEGDRVAGVRTRRGSIRARHVVVCTGAWTPALCRASGLAPLPIEPVRGQLVVLEPRAPGPATIVREEHVYCVPKRDGSLVVGSTEEDAGFEAHATAAGVATLAREACALRPSLARARFVGAWAGLRPAAPDRLPILGAWPGLDGLFVASAHWRNGVLLAPETARIAIEWLRGKGEAEALAPFSPARFLGR